MITSKLLPDAVVAITLGAVALIAPAPAPVPAPAPPDAFTLTAVIPDDVFLCAAERHNPERDFIARYWGEVFEALAQSGVGQDVIGLVSSLAGPGQTAEVQRLLERAKQLFEGVDWGQLGGQELVFAERFEPPVPVTGGAPPIFLPDMVCVMRGSATGAAQNYAGLVAILEAVAEEINRVAGMDALAVKKTDRMGTQVAELDLLVMLPGAPSLPLSVALRGDVIVIALREQLLSDVLGLMAGNGQKRPLSKSPRFQAAFAELPPAQDSLSFFDMQAMLKPLCAFLSSVVEMVDAPRDLYLSAGMTPEVNKLNTQAVVAYTGGDVKQALALVERAYEAAPQNSIVLYNLACFHALLGHKEEALGWLEKAVEGGFYAPDKIGSDSDLESLRDEARYKAALAKAAELARMAAAEDIAINCADTGEVYRLRLQALQAYEQKDYEQGLKLSEQAHALGPQDSKVLYSLACFHTLLGHEEKGLDFLVQAVDAGFYCPRHIAKDPDLESIRGDARYKAALTKAREGAARLDAETSGEKTTWVKRVLDQLADAAGIFDYTAEIESTKGYTVRAESLTALVPDAKQRSVYRVFGAGRQLTQFDRYLPQETESFSVSTGFDAQALYKFLEDSFRELGPVGEDALARWEQIQKQIGVDVQKDIIGWIDGGLVSITLADEGGSVWLLKVTDEEVARAKVRSAVEFLSTRLTETVARNPALAGLAMLSLHTSPADQPGLEGFENLHIAFSPEPAVWGVTDGHLVLGSSAEAVALCLATARGEHPNVRHNARLMSEVIVPSGPFVSLTLTDRRTLGKDLAKGIGVASMITGMAGSFVPEPEVRTVATKLAGILGKLTPVVRKIDFYKSTASHTTFDGQKWRSVTLTHYVSPAERAPQSAPGNVPPDAP